jgi:hypothetical protein
VRGHAQTLLRRLTSTVISPDGDRKSLGREVETSMFIRAPVFRQLRLASGSVLSTRNSHVL